MNWTKRPGMMLPGAALALLCLAGNTACKPAADRTYVAAAEKAAAWIQASQVRSAQGLSWPAVPKDPASVSVDLYSGMPGVVLFFLDAYQATGKKSYLTQARAGADFLLSRSSGIGGSGLYEGRSGAAFVLEEAFRTSGDSKYRRGFLEALEDIKAHAVPAGSGIEWSATTDIVSGGAGTGLFLIYAFHETGDRAWLDLAARAGARLIELGLPENGGLKWAMDRSFPRLMPNFSHGTAGIAYFLAALYQETKNRAFLDAALAGAKYLLSIAKTESESCLIFHDEPDNKGLYYLGWCHGPVGTARLFYLLSKATGDKTWLDWVRRSANSLLQSGIPEQETPGFWNNAGICCGLAGVGEFFLDLYRALGDAAYLEFSKRVASRLLAKATVEEGRMFWVQAEHRTRPDFLFAQTGYMQGAAGIGTFLLRLASADREKGRRVVFPDTPFTR
jgi:lantibiotic modifying enzyme